jgi:integrase
MARRRKAHYGEGSVYEYPKGSGRWFAAVSDGHGEPTVRRAPSREKAEEIRAEILRQRSEGLNTKLAGQTLAQFVKEWWTKGILPKNLAPFTLQDYWNTVDLYLLPDWGKHRLYEFNVLLILDIFKRLSEDTSKNTALRTLGKLSMILNTAIRWGILNRNAVEDARPDLPKIEAQTAIPLTIEQCWRLLQVVASGRHPLLYRMALLYGMRVGELLGLQWGDIDWERKTLTLHRQTQQINGKLRTREGTKRSRDGRVVPLTEGVMRALRRLWEQRGDCVYLFPSENATALYPTNFERSWAGSEKVARKNGREYKARIVGVRNKAGLPGYKFHWLRHTCSTFLMELGCPEEIRAGILGHNRKGITQFYSHSRLNAMRTWLELWDAELERGAKEASERDTG